MSNGDSSASCLQPSVIAAAWYSIILTRLRSLPIENQDRVSARGFAMGYIGAVLLQLVGFGLVLLFLQHKEIKRPDHFILSSRRSLVDRLRADHLSPVAIATEETKDGHNMWVDGFTELRKVWNKLKGLPKLRSYLLSFWFYSMGVQTVMLAATMFGQKHWASLPIN